jgi:hypothetical protein
MRMWRRYRRFLKAMRSFQLRGFRICMRSWHLISVAEANCRCVCLHKIVVKWRTLARNAAIWDEECAVLFLESARAGGCPQQALFVMCTDKLMWRRAKIEHNWGRGWRSGRPVPTREHAMVVQAIRRTSMWNLKDRMTRWKKRILWCKQRRRRAQAKLGEIFDKRRKEKFWLKFVVWRRWSVVHRCHRLKQELPRFDEPRIYVWNVWYDWFKTRQRLLGEEIVIMRSKFAYRVMYSAWMRYVDARRARAYEWKRTVDFCGRLGMVRATGAWREYTRGEKAMRHRQASMLRNWREVAGILKHMRVAERTIKTRWQKRYVTQTFAHMKQIALYMMVITAGGLRRLEVNHLRALWAMYAWITCDIEEVPANPKSTPAKAPPERLPGGLKAMHVCDAHFGLLDGFRLWRAQARRRVQFAAFMKVCARLCAGALVMFFWHGSFSCVWVCVFSCICMLVCFYACMHACMYVCMYV